MLAVAVEADMNAPKAATTDTGYSFVYIARASEKLKKRDHLQAINEWVSSDKTLIQS